MSKNSRISEEINFQHYVEAVKRKEITWNIFVDFIEDLSYSDINRLKNLNEILLMELTMDFSDLNRMKYLNVILLMEFKNSIQKMNNFKIEHIGDDEDPLKIDEQNLRAQSFTFKQSFFITRCLNGTFP